MAAKKKVELKAFDVAEHLRTPASKKATVILHLSPRRLAISLALRA